MKQHKGYSKNTIRAGLNSVGITFHRDFKRQVWILSNGKEFKTLYEIRQYQTTLASPMEKHENKRLDKTEVQAPVEEHGPDRPTE